MTTVSGTVTVPYHGFSTQYPFGIGVAVSAFGKVHHFSFSVSFQQYHIFIIPAAYTNKIRENPFTVGTPLEPLVTVCIRILVFGIHNSTYSFAFQIDNTNSRTVFKESNLLSVRAILWLERSDVRFSQAFFFQFGGISELLFFFTYDR